MGEQNKQEYCLNNIPDGKKSVFFFIFYSLRYSKVNNIIFFEAADNSEY